MERFWRFLTRVFFFFFFFVRSMNKVQETFLQARAPIKLMCTVQFHQAEVYDEHLRFAEHVGFQAWC